jgi:hypothetical protein
MAVVGTGSTDFRSEREKAVLGFYRVVVKSRGLVQQCLEILSTDELLPTSESDSGASMLGLCMTVVLRSSRVATCMLYCRC